MAKRITDLTLETVPISNDLMIIETVSGTRSTTLQAIRNAVLPSQSGNNGKFLTTDGTTMSWAASGYTLPNASASVLGGIKVGSNLSIDGNGVLSVTLQSSSGIPHGTANSTSTSNPTGDSAYNNVALLLHMDGTDGSTAFTDSSSHNTTVSPSGSITISTAQSKFGGASGSFGSGYLTIASNTYLNFGTSAFTIEGWVRLSSFNFGAILCNNATGWVGGAIVFRFDSGGTLYFYVNDYNSSVPVVSSGGFSLNQWYHIALVRSGNTVTLYVDGTSVSSNSSFTQSVNFNVGSGTFIGYSKFDNATLNGYIDDFRITTGTARYTANFLVPSAPFPNEPDPILTYTGGSVQWNQGGDFGGSANLIWDNANNILDITGDLSVSGNITGNITIPTASASVLGGVKVGNNLSISSGVLSAVIPTASTSVLGCVKVGSNLLIDSNGVLSVNLTSSSGTPHGTANTIVNQTGEQSDPFYNNVVLLLSMNGSNGSTTFTDTKGHTVTPNGNTQILTTQSKFGGASAYFDGTGDYLSITQSDDFAFGLYDFTFEFWIRTPLSKSQQNIFDLRPINNTGDYPYIGVFSNGDIFLHVNNVNLLSSGAGVILPNTWHHVAFSRNSNIVRVFVDGVLKSSNSDATNYISSNSFRVGWNSFGVSTEYYEGYIDDVRITKGISRYITNFTPSSYANPTTLSSYDPYFDNTQILLHMNGSNGSTTFTDEKGHSIAVNGNAQISTTQSKFGGASAYFDGNGDYLTSNITSPIGVDNFTAEAWIMVPSLPTIDNVEIICVGNNSSQIEFLLELTPSGNIRGSIKDGASVTNVDISTTSSIITTNTWFHIAFVAYGTNAMIFVNGALSISGSIIGTRVQNLSLVKIGYLHSGATRYFVGNIDDLRITKGISRYITNFALPTSAFPDSGPTSNDPYFNNVVLSLHMNGSNGSTTFTDVKGHTITPNGNAQISTTQSKFGGSSAHFDGNGDFLTLTTSDDFNLGTGDFTTEAWVNVSNISSLTHEIWCTQSTVRAFGFGYSVSWGGGCRIRLYDGTDILTPDLSSSFNINAWNHIAVSRKGTTFMFFLNGILVHTASSSASFDIGGKIMNIGSTFGTSAFLNGYIDDIRITKGVARYTTNFTPSTTTFSDTSESYINVTTATGGSIQWNANGDFGGSANLIWDEVNSRLGINKAVPTVTLDVVGDIVATGTVSGSNLNIDGLVPSQSGNTGKYLTTNGSVVSWATVSTTSNLDSLTDVIITTPITNQVLQYNGSNWVNATETPYSLPIASASTLGGIKVGNNLSINGSGILDVVITSGSGIPHGTANTESQSNPTGDAYLSSVTMLVHGDGTNGSTTFTDFRGHTPTVNGNAQISTTQSKFGGSSIKLDGDGDYLQYANSADFNFGAGDFTWEAWIYRVAVTDPTYGDAIWCSTTNALGFAVAINPDGKIGLCVDSSAGGVWDIRLGVDPATPRGTTALSLNTWYHIAVVRNGTNFYGFVDGVLDQSFTSSLAITDTTNGYNLGKWHDGNGRFFNGYIDDIRITKGVARYNSSGFTPPTAAFPETPDPLLVATSGSIQWNANGNFGGSANLIWDNQNNELEVTGSIISSSGNFATAGDAISKNYVLRNITTTATATELFIDGSSSQMVLVNNSTWYFDIRVVGRRTDTTGESASYLLNGCVDRNSNAASTALVGSVMKTIIAEDSGSWDVNIDVDTTSGALRIKVTGEAAKTIRWVAFVRTVEVMA